VLPVDLDGSRCARVRLHLVVEAKELGGHFVRGYRDETGLRVLAVCVAFLHGDASDDAAEEEDELRQVVGCPEVGQAVENQAGRRTYRHC
jgi:hypothetical protein